MTNAVRVRMYNVGFGDCFLITLPTRQTILVDAGFHSQGKGSFSAKELVDQVIADVTEIAGSPRIDVVVATHRHQDHIYAFNADEWDGVEVGEVWMPWVEDRKNKEATKLWKKQQRFALQLASVRGSFGLSPADLADVEFMLWNAGIDLPGAQFQVAGAGAGWSNQNALDCLHEGFAHRDRASPRFLPVRDCPETFESAVLPDVKVHVLGPPRDPDLIEELDPEADGETYRALALRSDDATGAIVAHHGSHNATSKTLVEKVLPKKIPAMISTQEGPGNYRNNIPLTELLDALDEHKIDYARSDTEDELPPRFKMGAESKWIDVELPC